MWAEAAGAAAHSEPHANSAERKVYSIEIAVWLAGDSATRVRPAGRRAASVDGATKEEKAAEGNVVYFAEFPSEEPDRKLRRHRDEDERTLLHIAAAAGARLPSRSRPSVAFRDPRPRRPDAHPPLRSRTLARRQDRPRRTLPRHRRRSRAREQGRRGSSPPAAPVPPPTRRGCPPADPSPTILPRRRTGPRSTRLELRPRLDHLPSPRAAGAKPNAPTAAVNARCTTPRAKATSSAPQLAEAGAGRRRRGQDGIHPVTPRGIARSREMIRALAEGLEGPTGRRGAT